MILLKVVTQFYRQKCFELYLRIYMNYQELLHYKTSTATKKKKINDIVYKYSWCDPCKLAFAPLICSYGN